MGQKSNILHYKTEYLEDSFPINLYTVTKFSCIPSGRGYRDLHWHDDLQFTIAEKGTLTMQVNGDSFILAEGEGIFINSGLLHIATEISEGGRYMSLNYPAKLFSFYPGSKMEQKAVLPYVNNYAFPPILLKPEIDWQHKILSKLRELAAELKNKNTFAFEYSVALKISMIWYQLISHVHTDIPNPSISFIRKQERIQRLIAFIHDNYKFEIKIEDIANSANISTAECCRCFKNMVHLSPYEYLTEYRITRSIDLLKETKSCITEISGQVGFNYASQYIKAFKKFIGMTPNEYRTYYFDPSGG